MRKPRVLIYDIETAPGLGWAWSQYDANILEWEQREYILSVAWKWLDQKKVNFLGIIDDPEFQPDTDNDQIVVQKLHALFDEADVIVAHNGDKFDRRKANARFAVHNLLPPSPSQSVDTLKVARKHFNQPSNSLAALGSTWGLGDKEVTTGWRLWRDCMRGDKKAWALMKRYNIQDVLLLESVYLKLRPWANGHPNMALIAGKPDACPRCGAEETLRKDGQRRTQTMVYQTWECRECGAKTSSRMADPDEPRPVRK